MYAVCIIADRCTYSCVEYVRIIAAASQPCVCAKMVSYTYLYTLQVVVVSSLWKSVNKTHSPRAVGGLFRWLVVVLVAVMVGRQLWCTEQQQQQQQQQPLYSAAEQHCASSRQQAGSRPGKTILPATYPPVSCSGLRLPHTAAFRLFFC